jgi:predicted phosphate transport protein (TIGR00153 family)
MQEHMHAAVACAHQILPFVEAMSRGDQDEMARIRTEIDRLEHEADGIKNQIRSNLPRRFFMAVERRDMLEILDSQDSIADVTQDAAELATLRAMVVPDAMVEPLLALTRRSIAACDQAGRIIDQLDELLETGFGEREVGRVEEMIDDLDRIESETDELCDTTLRVLFSIEDELGVGTLFWYKIIQWISDIADYAERVGNRLRLLLAG